MPWRHKFIIDDFSSLRDDKIIKLHKSRRLYRHLILDPWSNHVGLIGKLASEMVIRLLTCEFFLKSLITLWNQLLHLHSDRDNINNCDHNYKTTPTHWRKQCLIHNTDRSHLLPLLVNALRGDGGVRIVSSQFDAIVLCNFLNFSLDGLNSFPLFICLWKSWFELVMSRYQSLQKEREVKKCQRRDSCIQHFFCSATKQGSPFQRF